MMVEDIIIERATKLRDELVLGSIDRCRDSPSRLIHKIYPEADSEPLPDAVENLLGACSGAYNSFPTYMNLHS
jgi:hypothetical protein